MGSAVEISVVIVCYKSDDYIVDCIDSIISYSDLEQDHFEIVVVDNSPKEDADRNFKNLRARYSFRNLILIHNTHNGGYGQGNNVGISASQGKYICIMNPDVRLLEPLFKDVLIRFNNSELALLGYRQTGGFDLSFYIKPEFRSAISGWKTKFLNKFQLFDSRKHYLSGAFFFVSKEKFEEVGLFDENIFMYFEEPDIGNRLAAKKYKIEYDPSKRYLHLVGERLTWSAQSFSFEMRSLKYYLKKFNIPENTSIRRYLAEYQLKILIAKILNDKNRLEKFRNEAAYIKSMFLKKC